MFFGFSNQPKRRGPPVVKRKAQPMSFGMGFNSNFGNPGKTKARKNSINKGDWDRDGVSNMFDCRPMNFKMHSALLRKDIQKRLVIDDQADWDHSRKTTPREEYKNIKKKDVVRFFEKNPEMIKEAEKLKGLKGEDGTQISVRKRVGSAAKYERRMDSTPTAFNIKNNKPEYAKGDKQAESEEGNIVIRQAQTEKQDFNRMMKHELGHVKQDVEGRSELLRIEEKMIAQEKSTGNGTTLPWAQRPAEIDAIRYQKTKFEREKVHKERPQRLNTLDEPDKFDGSRYQEEEDEPKVVAISQGEEL